MVIDITDHDLQCETHNTYDVYFSYDKIFTTVTHDYQIVTDWITEVESVHRRRLKKLIVGLDIEWRPSFSRLQNPVATLQLAVGRRCIIYQFIHADGIPTILSDFLANRNYTFVGVGVKADLEKLDRDYGIGGDACAVDLGKLAADRNNMNELKYAGLKGLARVCLGVDMEKPKLVTLSKWDERWLTAEQVKYACVDAFVSFEIGRSLDAYVGRLDCTNFEMSSDKGSSSTARSSTTRSLGISPPPDPERTSGQRCKYYEWGDDEFSKRTKEVVRDLVDDIDKLEKRVQEMHEKTTELNAELSFRKQIEVDMEIEAMAKQAEIKAKMKQIEEMKKQIEEMENENKKKCSINLMEILIWCVLLVISTWLLNR